MGGKKIVMVEGKDDEHGILEDFLALLVPANSALFERVKRTVAEIPDEERLFPAVAAPKALIHTWLAWLRELFQM
jgi:hypothetical protein